LTVGIVVDISTIQQAISAERISPQARMPTPLTDRPGEPRRGKAVAVNSDQGNCIICHKMPIPEIPSGAFGDLGPPLDGVGARLSVAELRLRIVNAKVINPGTIMPAYHVIAGLHRVQARYVGQPILSAQDIEDLVAYLAGLR
jgi:sulfur-oxidizing protein SoxX